MKALVLAAGLGTRLRPYTLRRPKPLFPVLGVPLITHTLLSLKAAGVTDFFINLHHLPNQIPLALDIGSALGVRIGYSFEPKILGTGGAIRKLKNELCSTPEPFFVVNADMLFSLDLAGALAAHARSNAAATLVLFPTPEASRYGSVQTDGAGHVREFIPAASPELSGRTAPIFAGIHVLSPEIFGLMPDTDVFCIVKDVYKKHLGSGRIFGHLSAGTWQDIGNPEEYLRANMLALDRLAPSQSLPARAEPHKIIPPVFAGPGTRIGAGAEVGPHVVLGGNCRIAEGAKISRSVVWDGAAVSGTHENAILTDTPEQCSNSTTTKGADHESD